MNQIHDDEKGPPGVSTSTYGFICKITIIRRLRHDGPGQFGSTSTARAVTTPEPRQASVRSWNQEGYRDRTRSQIPSWLSDCRGLDMGRHWAP
jgi:hypothetical protein